MNKEKENKEEPEEKPESSTEEDDIMKYAKDYEAGY